MNKNKKKTVSIILMLVMVLTTLMPSWAFGENTVSNDNTSVTQQEQKVPETQQETTTKDDTVAVQEAGSTQEDALQGPSQTVKEQLVSEPESKTEGLNTEKAPAHYAKVKTNVGLSAEKSDSKPYLSAAVKKAGSGQNEVIKKDKLSSSEDGVWYKGALNVADGTERGYSSGNFYEIALNNYYDENGYENTSYKLNYIEINGQQVSLSAIYEAEDGIRLKNVDGLDGDVYAEVYIATENQQTYPGIRIAAAGNDIEITKDLEINLVFNTAEEITDESQKDSDETDKPLSDEDKTEINKTEDLEKNKDTVPSIFSAKSTIPSPIPSLMSGEMLRSINDSTEISVVDYNNIEYNAVKDASNITTGASGIYTVNFNELYVADVPAETADIADDAICFSIKRNGSITSNEWKFTGTGGSTNPLKLSTVKKFTGSSYGRTFVGGYTDDTEIKYCLFLLGATYKYDKTTKTASGSEALLLRIGAIKEGGVVKTELEKQLTAAASITADAYYTEDDRYNGKKTSETGFWQEYQTALETAKTVNETEAGLTQPVVDNAATKLESAIANLINNENVNATALYEAVKKTESLNQKTYTTLSWGVLSAQLDEANALLESLYVQEGDNKGEPTPLNNSVTKQQEVKDAADGLTKAIGELVLRTDLDNATTEYNKFIPFARELLEDFNPANMKEEDYTKASWDDFITKREDVQEVVGKAKLPTGESKTELDAYTGLKVRETVSDFRDACYEGLESAQEKITVNLKYISMYDMRNDVEFPGTGIFNGELTLGGNKTLEAAVEQSGIVYDKYTLDDGQTITHLGRIMVYINGEARWYNQETHDIGTSKNPVDMFGGMQLKDGDEIYLFQVEAPLYDYYITPDLTQTSIAAYRDSLSMIRIKAEAKTAKVGTPFQVTVTEQKTYYENIGQEKEAEGLAVFISGASEEESYTLPDKAVTGTTDKNGQLSYTFLEPGWHTISALSLGKDVKSQLTDYYTKGEYNTLRAGDFIRVYVEGIEGDELDAKMTELKTAYEKEAAGIYGKYHDYDFTATDWEAFKACYETLTADLASAETLVELGNGYDTNLAALKKAATKAYEHETILEGLRINLQRLPIDIAELTYLHSKDLKKTQATYNGLNSYQKKLLSKSEVVRLDALKDIDPDNLYKPAAVPIQIIRDPSLTLVPDAAGIADSATNENKVRILYTDGSDAWDYWSDGFYSYVVPTTNMTSDALEPSTTAMWVGSSYKNKDIVARPGNEVSIRRAIAQTDDSYWMVFSIDGGSTWRLSKHIVSRDNGNAVFQAVFTMPQTDADSLVIQYKAVSKNDYEQLKLQQQTPDMGLAEAKAAYRGALEDAFKAYDNKDYSDENYNKLSTAKDEGLDAIDQAADVSSALSAYSTAIAAMKAVPLKQVVHVIVENTTWSQAEGAPWDNLIVEEDIEVANTDSYMTCLLKALDKNGFTWNNESKDYNITYLASIEKGGKKLTEKDTIAGAGSGWMGTLNGWFTNEGFSQFTIANGKLKAGDEIRAQYTCDYGSDIGGAVEGDTNTTLKSLEVDKGSLLPEFSSDTLSYMYKLDKEQYSLKLTFTAANRSFQARAYVNSYEPNSDTYYSSGDVMPVKKGDVIYVAVGDPAWPSMAGNSGDDFDATVYTLVIGDDESYVIQLIEDLPEAVKLKITDRTDVSNAKAMYDALSKEQQAKISKKLTDKLNACVERMKGLEKIDNVISLIKALPQADTLKYSDKVALDKAQDAYDSLTEAQKDEIPVSLIEKLAALQAKMELLQQLNEGALADAFKDTGSYLEKAALQYTPMVSSTGGEWLILGLARSGYEVDASLYNSYLANVLKTLEKNKGVLAQSNYTEYSRVILALTALGEDVTNVGGYNLLEPLADFDKTVWQGINGAIFALIAFDSHGYEIPKAADGVKQTTRENLIDHILGLEVTGGGWALTGNTADADITAMAIQSLAPYYDSDSRVKEAVERGLSILSQMQSKNGGFGGWGTGFNTESTSQVIVALTALGIDPEKDSRFIKNGNSALDALLLLTVNGGGFKHTADGKINGMATEQGYYALTSYYRFLEGKTSLYNMSDVKIMTSEERLTRVQQLIDAIGDPVSLADQKTINAAVALYNSMTAEEQAKIGKDSAGADRVKKLLAAEKTLYKLEIKNVEDLITAIGTVTLVKEAKINEANAAYNALANTQKDEVGNYDTLQQAITKLAALKEAASNTPASGNAAGTTTAATGGATKAVTKSANVKLGETAAAKAAISKIDSIISPTDAANKLPDNAKDYTDEQMQSIIDAYKTYDELSPAEKLAVEKSESYKAFEEVLNKVGKINHYDETTATDLRDNDGEVLPWYIKLTVKPQTFSDEQDKELKDILGEESEVFSMEDISFVNILDGNDWHPEKIVKVKLPMVDIGKYKSAVIVHITDDGKMELIEGKVSGEHMVFEASDFSMYGIAGSMQSIDDLLGAQTMHTALPWLIAAAIALIAMIVIIIFIKRKRNRAIAGKTE